MTQRKKKAYGRPTSGDAKPKQESEKVIDRGPLAAYRIGHNCTVIRLFQVQRWDSLVPLQSDAVAEILDETRAELTQLPDLLDGKLSEYSRLRRNFTRTTNNSSATVFENIDDPSSWLEETSTGYSAWTEFVSFSESVFPEFDRCQAWFSLGKALAGFQVRLHFLGNRANLGQDPSIRPVVEAAVRLKKERWERIPGAIDHLAAQCGRMGELTTQQIFANAVDTSERQLVSEAGSFERRQTILKQAFKLDLLVRSSLLVSPFNREVPQILDETQANILKALDGKALTKDQIAGALSCDSSQLYQKQRIANLIKWGMVVHKTGIGYYRPNAMPPELDPRTYSVSANEL